MNISGSFGSGGSYRPVGSGGGPPPKKPKKEGEEDRIYRPPSAGAGQFSDSLIESPMGRRPLREQEEKGHSAFYRVAGFLCLGIAFVGTVLGGVLLLEPLLVPLFSAGFCFSAGCSSLWAFAKMAWGYGLSVWALSGLFGAVGWALYKHAKSLTPRVNP